ncbi:homoserine kinase [Halopseudomonas xinjiangensis]|uniref:Homoserine kinase n=1 Tax=Halopseudomonas xinjiangensis TaxID=487184 RepID=A0A1H1Y544_9GAMM|nr:homoserine kinase [Halopseudomonas xinjiangensis]SDT16570.1 homoserine kinase [Halopseudomonas xinjiangensis]
MSVFTPVERSELELFIGGYDVGRLVSHAGIEGGSENSNFFVECERGSFVLTLVERGPVDELDFFVALLECLHQADLPVPYAIADRQGRTIQRFKDRPALLQPRLPGRHVQVPTIEHCAALGAMLARLHQVSSTCGLERQSDRGPEWMLAEVTRCRRQVSPSEAELLDEAAEALRRVQQRGSQLPKAVLHADLFRDNVMFEGHRLTGIIDFYNAASGWTLYDLAICVNDWCMSEHLRLDPLRSDALLAAYAAQRPFTASEAECWPDLLRIAALRFWLSRQIAVQAHADQPGVLVKEPQHFMHILEAHREVSVRLAPFI